MYILFIYNIYLNTLRTVSIQLTRCVDMFVFILWRSAGAAYGQRTKCWHQTVNSALLMANSE